LGLPVVAVEKLWFRGKMARLVSRTPFDFFNSSCDLK
jgi:hypothetical protein